MPNARQLAEEALRLSDDGNLDAAIALYREAVLVADPAKDDMWQIRGQFASTLARAGNLDEAISEYQRCLQEAERQGAAGDSSQLAVTRYFLGQLYVAVGDGESALSAVAKSLAAGSNQEALLRAVEAEALWKLGDREQARSAAERSLVASRTDDQRGKLAKQLEHILGRQPNSS